MLHTDTPHESPAANVHLGTAGWNIRREHADRFPSESTHLARYASLFNAVEINSCFYRPHRFTTYERWAASVPEDFRFAVKLPKVITDDVEEMLVQHRIARVAADPARVSLAAEPGGYAEIVYIRLHGSPRIYYSAYPTEFLERVSQKIQELTSRGTRTWCIFDNTALGAATSDALTVKSDLLDSRRVTR